MAMATPDWSQSIPVIRKYGVEDGLAANSCLSVSSGPRGRALVKHSGSESISSLDGYTVRKIPAPPKFGGKPCESPGGQLWSLWEGGLQEYDGKDWHQYKVLEIQKEYARNPAILQDMQLLPTKQGHVLFLLADALCEFNNERSETPKTSTIHLSEQSRVGSFTGMVIADDGGLWISGQRGVVKLSGPIRTITRNSRWQDYVPSTKGFEQFNYLEAPTLDEEGGLILLGQTKQGSLKAVVHFNGKRWSVLSIRQDDYVRAWRGVGNIYWAATRDYLLAFEENGGDFRQNQQLPVNKLVDLAIEPHGVFWIASLDGLFRYAPPAWSTPAAFSGLDSKCESVTQDARGRIWLVQDNSLFLFHEDAWETFVIPPKIFPRSETAKQLFALNDGSLIIETKADLIQFQPRTSKFRTLSAITGKQLKPLGFLRDGTLCLELPSSANGESRKLVTFDGEALGSFPFAQPDLSSNRQVQHLYASGNGDLWLTGERYLSRYHSKEWQTFLPADGLVPEGALCLTEVSDNKIWFGMMDRIWEFDGKSWSLIRSGFGKINELVRSREGSVWVATAKGLYRFYQGTWALNGTVEGLPDENIEHLSEDSRGRVWVATEHCLSIYHADADLDPPQTIINPLREDNNSLLEGAIVPVSYAGRDKWKYTPAERLLYSYRLDERDWSPFSEEKTASFQDLAAGKHYFQVRSMDRNWNIDPKPSILEFAITLRWYQETRLLLVAALAATATLVFGGLALNRHRQLLRSYSEVEQKVAQRTKELELANQELLHSQKMNALGTLAAGIAHDFNNILSIIKGSAQIIEENVENQDKIRVRIGRIKTVVEQGAGIVRAMLGFSRGPDQQELTSDVNSVVDETVRLLGDRFLREVEVEVRKAESLPSVRVSKDFIQQILLNFIFNAAEAMPHHKQIILSSELINQLPGSLALAPKSALRYVAVSVADVGTGIPAEIMPRIFEPFFTTKAFSARRGTGLGLSMVYELAKKIDAGLAVTSTVDKGSRFTLLLPVDTRAGENL
ncbi:ATP-binding protein [Pedosphaera parvula]|nr:ATP-binding protein [Pedosphaera parvula]